LAFGKSGRVFAEAVWSVDRTFTAVAILLLWSLAFIGIVPGLSGEFSASPLALSGHALAYGAGSWWLLVILAAALVAEILRRPRALSMQVLAAGVFSAGLFISARGG